MNSGKIKAVLFIIVFLLVTAVVASWFVSRDPAGDPFPAPGGMRIDVHQVCPAAGRMGDGGHHPAGVKL